jgi:hypothetical protein
MVWRVLCVWLCVAAVAAAAGPVGAEGWHGGSFSSRLGARDVRVKDCTRLNGRYGYYGNPWCTPREQARWDRWQATRRQQR